MTSDASEAVSQQQGRALLDFGSWVKMFYSLAKNYVFSSSVCLASPCYQRSFDSFILAPSHRTIRITFGASAHFCSAHARALVRCRPGRLRVGCKIGLRDIEITRVTIVRRPTHPSRRLGPTGIWWPFVRRNVTQVLVSCFESILWVCGVE